MRTRQTLPLILLFMVLLIVGACATESQTQPTPTLPIDKPYLSPQEAISIAQEHSINSPLNIYERQASMYAKRGGTQGWNARIYWEWEVDCRTAPSFRE